MRLIDADRLKEVLKRNFYNSDIFEQIIDAQSTIDPVKHGKWIRKRRRVGDIHEETGYVDFDGGVGVGEPITIKVDGRIEYVERYCSECGAVCSDSWNNYCGCCGARMDGDNK